MKKNVWIIVGIVVLCIVLIVAFWPSRHRINPNQVERIAVPGGPHSEEDTERFIELFNKATYKGTDIGYGTTPEYHCEVYLTDGSYLLIHQYGGPNFRVNHYVNEQETSDYFIESRQLADFISELRRNSHQD